MPRLLHSLIGAVVATALLGAGTAVAVPGGFAEELDRSLFYCDGTLDGGASGALTDAEHSVLVGDPPLPDGVRERQVTAAGIPTRVVEAGPSDAEEAVVFVHGNPGSARDFDALVAATGEFARAVSFDVPGLGDADDRPGLDYTVEGVAAYLDTLLAELGIRRVHLVLHDFGGPFGLHWGVEHPDALESVVLINTGVFIGYFGHPAALSYATGGVGEIDMATLTRDRFTGTIQAQNPDPLPSAFLDRMYDDYDRATRCAALQYYRSIENPDAFGRAQAAELRKRPRPALVIWGEDDPYIPADVARRQDQAFPGARVEFLPDTGHWPFVEEPERTRDLAVSFLRDVLNAQPPLALTRRCTGDGRLRVRLTGELDAVRDTNFKLDRRLARRDTEPPFEQVLSRRTLARTDARRLRAVAYLDRPGSERVILSRSLPRCAARSD